MGQRLFRVSKPVITTVMVPSILLTPLPMLCDSSVFGDVNGDGVFDRLDPDYLLAWLFNNGPAPVACANGADYNGDGSIDIADAIAMSCALTGVVYGDMDGNGSFTWTDSQYLFDYLFGGGPAPVACASGVDFNGNGSVNIADVQAMIAALPCPPNLAGDANGDGSLNIADFIYALDYYQGTGPAPVPCVLAADLNGDGRFDIADLIAYGNLF